MTQKSVVSKNVVVVVFFLEVNDSIMLNANAKINEGMNE